MVSAFPKIFAIGSRQTERLFNNEVEITEKIDGSQIAFGKVNDQLFIRSKGSQIFIESVDKMFQKGVDVIRQRFDDGLLYEGIIYYGEYLRAPKHNVLTYENIPNNHIALYGIYNLETQRFYKYINIQYESCRLNLDVVPLLFQGQVKSVEDLKENLNRISQLGKAKIEGFVIKNYEEQLIIGGQVIPILMGKYVSEDFKEVHKFEWKSQNTSRGKWDVFKSQFCNTARWHKAIQHLRDDGKLELSPRDIGNLINAINKDIIEEEMENIKTFLWGEYGKEVLREAVRGFPEWYKNYLLEKSVIPSQETKE